jgi:hypothetical protein
MHRLKQASKFRHHWHHKIYFDMLKQYSEIQRKQMQNKLLATVHRKKHLQLKYMNSIKYRLFTHLQ